MPRQDQSVRHWHDSDYTLEPHSLRIRANSRQTGQSRFGATRKTMPLCNQSCFFNPVLTGADAATSETDDSRVAEAVPTLQNSTATTKRQYPMTCCVSRSPTPACCFSSGRQDLIICCVWQVDDCGKDLSKEKEYYKRYRVCEDHLRLSTLSVDGIEQRFCQQCGRFHPLASFDDDKRWGTALLRPTCTMMSCLRQGQSLFWQI